MVGFAGTGSVEPRSPGSWRATTPITRTGLPEAADWSIYSGVCARGGRPACRRSRIPIACQLHGELPPPTAVAKGGTPSSPAGSGPTTLTPVDGLTCPDGSTAPLHETFKFDAITMTGVRTVSYNQSCGLGPHAGEEAVHAVVTASRYPSRSKSIRSTASPAACAAASRQDVDDQTRRGLGHGFRRRRW